MSECVLKTHKRVGVCMSALLRNLLDGLMSDGVRVRFRVRFQAVKIPIFGGLKVENPTKKANRLKALLKGISLSEYGAEGFRVQLRRLPEYGSVV